jgi:hypothetical protein
VLCSYFVYLVFFYMFLFCSFFLGPMFVPFYFFIFFYFAWLLLWHIYTSFLQSNNSLSLLVAEENFFYFIKSETRLSHGDHVFCPIGMKCANRIEDLQ